MPHGMRTRSPVFSSVTIAAPFTTVDSFPAPRPTEPQQLGPWYRPDEGPPLLRVDRDGLQDCAGDRRVRADPDHDLGHRVFLHEHKSDEIRFLGIDHPRQL